MSCGALAVISFHISTQGCDKNITLKRFLTLYFYSIRSFYYGRYHYARLLKATYNPREKQEQIFRRILRRNAETEYSRKMGLDKISSIDEFRSRHPLSDFDQFAEYMERTAKGEDNVLLSERPASLVSTSGTTGKPKFLPRSKEATENISVIGDGVCQGVFEKELPPNSLTQTICQIYTNYEEYLSEGGIVISAGSSILKKMNSHAFVGPSAAYRISCENDSMYVQALFALKDEYLGHLTAAFCHAICTFFSVIESRWKEMLKDISTGTITSHLDIPSDIRSELNLAMKPDPIRAEELRREFERGFDGIALRVWPHLNLLSGINSPSFQHYGNLLENKYAKGNSIRLENVSFDLT